MTAQQFIDSILGKHIDYDGAYGAQCVDIIKKYFVDCIGIGAIRNNAVDYWTNYPTGSFTRITNTPSFLPIKGDIMIWGTGVGQYGHIALIESANLNTFVSIDQNWPFDNGTGVAHRVTHNYKNVLGVLRPKKDVNFDQAAYEAELRRQAEEAARIAAEKQAEADRIAQLEAEAAKAEADRIQKEQAAKEKAEQEKIALEQAKLEAEVEAQKAEQEKWYSFFTNLIKFIKELIWN